MAEINTIEIPEGFVLDTPEAPPIPEGFQLDEPVELEPARELPKDIELFGQVLSESDASRFLADLRSEKIEITRGEEVPVLTPTGLVLKGPADIRDKRRREAEDGWAEVMGRSVIQGGLVVPTTIGGASRFLNDLLGLDFRGVGPGWLQDIPDFYGLAKEADKFWQPKVEQNEKKRLGGQILRTMTEMGAAALFTGGPGMLPALSTSAGLQKFVEAREEGAEFWRATVAGTTQAAIEYTTEKLPIGILLKPGLSFSRRLMLGIITDVPGELLATSGEMALVDTQILGKRYTVDQYIASLKETAIVAVGVTGGMTVASHPMIQEIEEFEKEVKSDPETFEAEFEKRLEDLTRFAEPLTPEEEAEVIAQRKDEDIETATKALIDIGFDEKEAKKEASGIAEKAAKLREIFFQEEIEEAKADPIETITADISGQLQATGRFSQEDADLQAEALYGAFFDSMAKRVGLDPLTLFRRFNVSIGRTRAGRAGLEPISVGMEGIVTLTESQRRSLETVRTLVEEGEAGRRGFREAEIGGAPEVFGIESTFPEFFKNKGLKKKPVLVAIDKMLVGEKLTDKQRGIVEDLNEGYRQAVAEEAREFRRREADRFEPGVVPDLVAQEEGFFFTDDEELAKKDPEHFTTDPNDPRILFQTAPDQPVFFSQLGKVAEEKIPDKIPAQDAFNILKKNTKPEELKWSGVEDFLKDKKTVTKDELLEFLRANEITVVETQKGGVAEDTVDTTGWTAIPFEAVEGDWEVFNAEGNRVALVESDNEQDAIDSAARNLLRDLVEGTTKFEDQTLPGGEDYTELLLRLPVPEITTTPDIIFEEIKPGQIEAIVNGRKFGILSEPEGVGFFVFEEGGVLGHTVRTLDSAKQRIRDAVKDVRPRQDIFTGGHFDEPNVVAHIRFNTRTDSEGNKVLFIEEIQSDWAAKGRKEGFKKDLKDLSEEKRAELIKERNELDAQLRSIALQRDDAFQQKDAEKLRTLEAESREINTRLLDITERLIGKESGVPSAPLLKKWHELALKRMLRYAAENDFDKLAWISGEQTADRYDLSKVIDEITYRRTAVGNFELDALKDGGTIIRKGNQTHSDLESLVGKEITNKIEAGEGVDLGEGLMLLKNVDLKVGGAWAKTLYDKVIPNFLKKYGKQWGVKVEPIHIDQFVDTETASTAELDAVIRTGGPEALEAGLDQQSIDITDEMKESVLAGQPLFQKQKGRIIFDPEGVKIELLKDADPSTFLHETGHFYLKVLSDLTQMDIADQELIDDAQIVADWLGAPTLAVVNREQSETFARGFEAYLREGKAPSSALRRAFAQFKEWLTEVYQRALSLNVKLTPEVRGVMDRMLASQEEIEAVQTEIDEATIDLVTEGKDLNKITQAEIKKHLTPAARRTVKGLILETVGKRKAHKFIREDKALSASWKKAEQSARKAFKAGKLEEAAKWKTKMKDVIVKANFKVEKIETEKQKMAKRRRSIATIKNFLDLTDAQMKGLTKQRNVANMTDWEFKQFKDDLLIRAEEVQETVFQKSRVMEIIQRKRLGKVENYQKSLGLPTISKMSSTQLSEFVDLLEVFEDADVFLTTRELETVDRTDLKGVKTWREAKERLAKETGASIEDLNAIKVNWTDKFKWDNALAESNPFYSLIVTEMNKKLLQAEARVHEVENEVFRLAKASEKSRGRSITRALIPQDPQVMAYLEATEDVKPSVAKEMTPEQLDLAHFMNEYFGNALEYLIRTQSLDKGRENYFVHIRRSFLETLKDDGLGTAIMSVFQNYQLEQMVFNILDGDTGNILPLEKFFQFSLRRTGALTPTQNVVKAFLAYSRTFEKKVTLDELLPKLDIYAQSLTPRKYTSRGLEIDRSIKKFVYQFVNNKKGRQIDLGFVKQGDKIDLAVRFMRTFTTLLDLGASIPVGAASFIGEQVANFTMLGEKGIILGTVRGKTKKGKAILKEHEAFVGRSAWEEFTQPGKEIGERVMEGMFGLFHQATVTANKQFLLASLTKEEYDSGKLSTERLAQLRIEMGRFRAIPGAKSLVGSTSPGGAAIQYKSWAVPPMRTTIKDIEIFLSDLKNKPTGEALTTREARELFRIVRLSLVVLLALGLGDREDKTFVGQLSYKARRETLTVLQALSPDMWLSTPRLIGFISQLGKNLKSLILLEEYKTKPGLKGVGGIKKQFTPSVVRQLTPGKEKRQRR